VKIKKTVPILCVENIEQSLPFWTDILGYKKTVEVPHQGKIGFTILVKNESEIMLQTHASVTDDLPEVAKRIRPGSIFLYSDVDSIEETIAALKTVKPLVPLRTTFYGAKEIFVIDPAGNILGFSENKQ